MRLTNSIRQAFVQSVLDDVPKTDYQEQLRELIKADAYKQLPAEIQRIADDNTLISYLNTSYHNVSANRDDGFDSYFSLGMQIYNPYGTYQENADTKTTKLELIGKHLAQEKTLNALREKLRVAIEAVNTVKQAKEVMPEFAKYLPAEVEKSNGLPAPIFKTLLSDLKNVGFPKGEVMA